MFAQKVIQVGQGWQSPRGIALGQGEVDPRNQQIVDGIAGTQIEGGQGLPKIGWLQLLSLALEGSALGGQQQQKEAWLEEPSRRLGP